MTKTVRYAYRCKPTRFEKCHGLIPQVYGWYQCDKADFAQFWRRIREADDIEDIDWCAVMSLDERGEVVRERVYTGKRWIDLPDYSRIRKLRHYE